MLDYIILLLRPLCHRAQTLMRPLPLLRCWTFPAPLLQQDLPDTSGTVIPQQPGFDNTNNANYSAEFPYNGFSAAPNNTLGGFEWTQPQTLMFHVDRLNWSGTGRLVLASKGDIASGARGNSCFRRQGFIDNYVLWNTDRERELYWVACAQLRPLM